MSHTVTKEEIMASIDQVPPEKFETLKRFIKGLSTGNSRNKNSGETFMEKMRKVSFEGPSDFSENVDEYLYGDKTF